MGDLRPDNGGNGLPPDDGGLPGLPPEWGTVVVPDDPGALADEAAALRRELRRERRHNLVRRVFGLPPVRVSRGEDSPNLGVPLIIMAVAILTTLVSLFVVTWDHKPAAPPLPPVVTTGANLPSSAASSAGGAGAAQSLADLTFVDGAGRSIRLGDLLPGVVLLVDGCACADLVIDLAQAAATANASLIAVDRSAPKLAGAPRNTHGIADPDGVLRLRYLADASPVPGKPSALIVRRSGTVVTTLLSVASVDDLNAPLAALGK